MNNSILYNISLELDESMEYDRIYNRLIKMCKSIMEIDKFPFDLNLFSSDDLKEFLKCFLIILDSNEDMVKLIDCSKRNMKVPNKKLLSNLQKKDVDNALDYMIKRFVATGTDFSTNASFIPVINISRAEADISLAEQENEYRNLIRFHKNSSRTEMVHYCLGTYLRGFKGQVESIRVRREGGWLNLIEAHYVIYVALELFNDIFFQIINYSVIDSPELSFEKKVTVLTKLNNVGVIQQQTARKQNIFYSFGTYLFYLEQRNRYSTYSDILKLLSEQMKKEEYKMNVDDKYRCKERWLNDVKTKKELREIILEGENEKEERFNKNLEGCKEMITILFLTAGRQLHPEYLQHVKVVYREIIEDRIEYNGKQAKTILRTLQNNQEGFFEVVKDTFFVREKISRGMFREKGYSSLYILKNELQVSYYDNILKAFESYDILDIAENLKATFYCYSNILRENI